MSIDASGLRGMVMRVTRATCIEKPHREYRVGRLLLIQANMRMRLGMTENTSGIHEMTNRSLCEANPVIPLMMLLWLVERARLPLPLLNQSVDDALTKNPSETAKGTTTMIRRHHVTNVHDVAGPIMRTRATAPTQHDVRDHALGMTTTTTTEHQHRHHAVEMMQLGTDQAVNEHDQSLRIITPIIARIDLHAAETQDGIPALVMILGEIRSVGRAGAEDPLVDLVDLEEMGGRRRLRLPLRRMPCR